MGCWCHKGLEGGLGFWSCKGREGCNQPFNLHLFLYAAVCMLAVQTCCAVLCLPVCLSPSTQSTGPVATHPPVLLVHLVSMAACRLVVNNTTAPPPRSSQVGAVALAGSDMCVSFNECAVVGNQACVRVAGKLPCMRASCVFLAYDTSPHASRQHTLQHIRAYTPQTHLVHACLLACFSTPETSKRTHTHTHAHTLTHKHRCVRFGGKGRALGQH